MYTFKKSKHYLIVSILLAVVLCLFGVFMVFRPNKKATASADSGFSMLDGMALSVEPGDAYIKLTVYVTQDMYDKLNTATKEEQMLWWTYYFPGDYYLQITRHKTGDSSTENDYTVNYHIDPEHSYYSAEKLSLKGSTELYLAFPYNSDYAAEYDYTCSFMQHVEYQDYLNGEQITAHRFDKLQTTNTVTRSVAYVAGKVLEYDAADYNADQLTWFKELAGVTTNTEKFTVNLVYNTTSDWGYLTETQKQYSVNSLYVASPNMVYGEVMQIHGAKSITDFNCVYKDKYTSRIVLQADGYGYTYDSSSQTGTLTITYREFDYSNFAVRLQDNDEGQENDDELYMYLYSDDVSYASFDWEGTGTKAYITFDYATIAQQCFDGLGWIFELDKSNFTIDDSRAPHIDIVPGANALTISFYPEYEDELKDVSVFANAEIIPDYECSVYLNYAKLSFDGNTILDETQQDKLTMMYSAYIKLNYWSTFQASEYYSRVTEALALDELNGEIYLIPYDCYAGKIEGTTDFEIIVKYKYNTLISIRENITDSVHFRACTNNSLEYTYSDLNLQPPTGWRLVKLTSNSSRIEIVFDETEYEKCKVALKTDSKQKLIIPLTAEYSDKYNLNIEYMKPYKNTPFAVKTIESVEVKVADYADITKLAKADIIKLLGIDNLIIGRGMVDANNEVKVVLTNTSTYTATVTYGEASLKQIDYDGHANEIKVPLTSYVDWCNSFGADWTILYLNTQDTKYFQYSNEVNREDLYGFFAVAVFEEQVSDLNYWFRNNTGDGQMTIFSSRAVEGSSLYKFFNNMTTKGIVSKAIGTLGMMMCETIDDSNKMYQSYYFYLDGSSDNAYIANGGADDAFDDDSALENKGEDVAEDVQNWWGEFKEDTKSWWQKFRESPWDTVLLVALCVVGGVILLGIAWKFGRKYFLWVTADTKRKRKTTRKKK